MKYLDNDRVRWLFEELPIPMYCWRAVGEDLEFVDFNRAAQEATRGKVTSLLDMRASRLYADQREVLADLRRCATGESFSREMRYALRTTGEVRDVEATFVFVPPNLVIAHLVDLTEARRREATLQAILETVADGIVTIDSAGTVRSFNRAAETLFGYATHEVLGQNVSLLMASPNADRHDAYLGRYLDTGEARIIGVGRRVLGRRKDATTFPLHLAVNEIPMAGTRLFAGVVRDLSAAERGTEALQRSEARYRALVEGSAAGILHVGSDNTVVYANRALLDIAGVTVPADVIGRRLQDLSRHLPDETRAAINGQLERRRQGLSSTYELEVFTQSGQRRRLLVSAAPIAATQQDRPETVASLIDVTERWEAECRLKESEERFHRLAESVRAGFWIGRPANSEILYVNPAFEGIWGRTQEEMCAATGRWLDTIHPEERSRVAEALRQSPVEYVGTHRILRPDGAVRTVKMQVSPMVDGAGNPTRVAGLAEDVTDDEAIRLELDRIRIGLADAQRIAHLGNWEWDIRGDNLWWSDETYRIFGLERDQFQSTYDALLERVHPDDRQAVVEAVERTLAEGDLYGITHRLVRPDGGVRVVEERAELLRDSLGRPQRMIGTAQDVTARRVAEEALRRLSSAVEQTADSVIITDNEGRIEFVNPAFERHTGFLAKDILGQTPRILKSGRHPARFFEDMWSHLVSGRVFRGVFINRKKSGEIFFEEKTVTPIRGEGGRITHYVSTGRDITERLRSEQEQRGLQEAVRRSAMEWRATFDAIDMLVVLVALDGTIARANTAARRLLGLDFDRIVGQGLDSFAGEPWDAMQRALHEVQERRRAATLQVHQPEPGRSWDVQGALLNVRSGAGSGIILLARDITATVRLQDSLRRSERMSAMGALVAGVAHEVRNPLFGISATLDAMETSIETLSDLHQYTSRLRMEAERLTDLMQDLLEYGRPAATHLSEGDIASVIERAVQSNRMLAEAKGVRIQSEMAAAPPTIMMDVRRLTEVFRNVLENGVQHSPRGGRVHVAVEVVRDGWIESRVADEGPGFAENDLPLVFEPFFTRRRGGTGLGLSIVQKIVEEHGGSVAATNGSGAGAVVIVRLPCLSRRDERHE